MTDLTATPALTDLSPKYVESQHWVYVGALIAALSRRGPNVPRNIAITGPYGSGKSSVLDGVTQHLLTAAKQRLWGDRRRQASRVATISLSSLGTATIIEPSPEGAADAGISNLLQKEIVKQLLYREPPSRMRSSRYRRISPFKLWPSLAGSAGVSIVLAAVVKLADKPARLADHGWLLVLAAVLATVTLTCARWRLAGRIWLEKLTAGPATVTLSAPSNSYFDDYLDEIVYFFTASGCRVVIFEDLDRFNNAHIFETLRGLNTILNTAKQLDPEREPVRFLYAVRDSIFELLDSSQGDEGELTGTTHEHASTSRTKFFDLVVPLVPFITSRTSRGLLAEVMKEGSECPGSDVIKIVSRHVTDMRLVHNIHNEFEIFRTRILPSHGGIPGLDGDRLFAMIAYKNLHLGDFERIRSGSSKLDEVYDAYRQMVNEQITLHQADIADAEACLAQNALTLEQRTEFGGRLIEFLRLSSEVGGQSWPDLKQLWFTGSGSGQLPLEAATSIEFWRDVLASRQVQAMFAGSSRNLRLATIEKIVGADLDPEKLTAEARAGWEAKIAEAQSAIDQLRWADLPTMFSMVDLKPVGDSPAKSLRAIAVEILNSPLAVDLLAEGYIDQNFSLYSAQYHGGLVGPRARNFLMHVAERGGQDVEYTFDRAEDIVGMVDELGVDFLRTPSAHNIAIFDGLFDERDDLLQVAIEGLTDATADAPGFILTYLDRGKHDSDFIGALSAVWDGTFAFLATRREASRWLNTALVRCSTERTYTTNRHVRRTIETVASHLPVLTSAEWGGNPMTTAQVLAQLGVRIPALAPLHPGLRRHVVELGSFVVTRANLAEAAGDPHMNLSLDALAREHPRIFDHAAANLSEYIADLEQHESAVEDAGNFVVVLNLLAHASTDELAAVLEHCDDLCHVSDLRSVRPHQWPALARASRCSATMANIEAYIEQHGQIDDALGELLGCAGEVEAAGTASPARRNELAIQILNTAFVPLHSVSALVRSLSLEAPISGTAVKRDIGTIAPDLVSDRILADDVDAFPLVEAEEWPVKDRLASVSETFADYIPQLGLAASDLDHLTTSSLPEHVRVAALRNWQGLEDATPAEASRIANRAAADRLTVPFESLVVLARRGAEPRVILTLLAMLAADQPIADVFGVIEVLPEPYASITRSSSSSPTEVPEDDRPAFEALKAAGYIESVKKVPGKPRVRIVRVV